MNRQKGVLHKIPFCIFYLCCIIFEKLFLRHVPLQAQWATGFAVAKNGKM